MLSSAALLCLALTIYHEARGEPLQGQKAVAHVVINRVKHPDYPDDVCAVVYQGGQFSWVRQRPHKPKGPAWDQAKSVAFKVLIGESKDPTWGATHFHTVNTNPKRSYRLKRVKTINNHVFYKLPPKKGII